MPMVENILTIREVADLLKINEKTVYKLAADAKIPGFKVGGSWRFDRATITKWIEKGSAPDNDMYNAQESVIKKYPDIKVVATVYGQATASVAQAAVANVLPSLPHVDAVLGQGGSDDVGIAQAFTQYGGDYANHMPIIEGGGGTDFVKWWAEQNKKNGYQTVSMNTTPGIGGAALWLGVSLLEGAKAPKLMIMPVATVDASNLEEYAKLPGGQIISPTYSLDWVKQNLLSK
jgi:ribose transport system substrate-binding protein